MLMVKGAAFVETVVMEEENGGDGKHVKRCREAGSWGTGNNMGEARSSREDATAGVQHCVGVGGRVGKWLEGGFLCSETMALFLDWSGDGAAVGIWRLRGRNWD